MVLWFVLEKETTTGIIQHHIGAGRIMSRNKAKEMFKLEEFKESMKDVYSSSVVEETIDEAPFVYKPMQEIIDNIGDTVDIQKIIKPIYNFKATN